MSGASEGWAEGLASVSEDARREAGRLHAEALEVLRTAPEGADTGLRWHYGPVPGDPDPGKDVVLRLRPGGLDPGGRLHLPELREAERGMSDSPRWPRLLAETGGGQMRWVPMAPESAPASSSLPVLTSADPEPPPGTIVRDSCGGDWRRGYDEDNEPGWVRTDIDSSDPESWAKIAGNYGPVTVLERGDDG